MKLVLKDGFLNIELVFSFTIEFSGFSNIPYNVC